MLADLSEAGLPAQARRPAAISCIEISGPSHSRRRRFRQPRLWRLPSQEVESFEPTTNSINLFQSPLAHFYLRL